jgi:hypothetical protein
MIYTIKTLIRDLLLVAAFTVTAVCQAQQPIHAVVLVSQNFNPSRNEISRIVNESNSILSVRGISITKITYRANPVPEPIGLSIGERARQLSDLSTFGRQQNFDKNFFGVIFIGPPLIDGGIEYNAGLAQRVGAVGREKFAIVNLRLNPESSKKRVIALAHEVSHLGGAGHTDVRVNLMHPDAMRFADSYYGRVRRYLGVSIEQIKLWLTNFSSY